MTNEISTIRNRSDDGKYAKWETCDRCAKSFGAHLDDCFYAFANDGIICAECVLNADPDNNDIENYESIIEDLR